MWQPKSWHGCGARHPVSIQLANLRGFCAACGSTLTFQRGEAPPKFSIAQGSLDDGAALTPRQHIYTADALPWLEIGDDLARHGQNAPQES